MHAEYQRVFDEHASPTHASKADVHGSLAPVLDLVSRVQMQVATYRRLVLQAESAEHDAAYDGKTARLHQTFGAVDRAVATLVAAGRELMLATTQLDRYLAEDKALIAAYDAKQLEAPDPAIPREAP